MQETPVTLRSSSRLRLHPVFVACLLAAAGGCRPSTADIATGEMILGISDAMNDLRTETAILQEQIDSLSAITARQDSLIRRLADHTGMHLPR